MFSKWYQSRASFLTFCFLLAAGCGNSRYPVHAGRSPGKTAAPISVESMVVFESVDRNPNITVPATWNLTAFLSWGPPLRPGMGPRPGKYRVKITPLLADPDEPAPHAPSFGPAFH